jgi:hypothetical protein
VPKAMFKLIEAVRMSASWLWKMTQEWWAREDSNLQPSGYEPLALTIELRARPTALAASADASGADII